METVKMIASVAGEEVFCGECHPARARVLVKKQLASWKDGKVLLHILNVHDQLLTNNPDARRGPLDDENVSKQELERRFAWFRSFMKKAADALSEGAAMELPSREEADAWVADRAQRQEDIEEDVAGQGWRSLSPRASEAPMSDADVGEWFIDLDMGFEAVPAYVPVDDTDRQDLVKLSALWEGGESATSGEDLDGGEHPHVSMMPLWASAPDVGGVFNVPSSLDAPVASKRDVGNTRWTQDRERIRERIQKDVDKDAAEADRDWGTAPDDVRATLNQVRLLRHRRGRD